MRVAKCQLCGQKFEFNGRGRARKFCDKCKVNPKEVEINIEESTVGAENSNEEIREMDMAVNFENSDVVISGLLSSGAWEVSQVHVTLKRK